jgi:hypothetical protein
MAKIVSTNGFVSINGVDLSDRVKKFELTYNAELLDDTAHGATTRSRVGGLKNWSLAIEFFQDYAVGEVDATLFGLVGTTFTVIVKPVNTTTAPTNPQFSGTGILESYPPIAAPVGEVSMANVTIQSAGTLTRATA